MILRRITGEVFGRNWRRLLLLAKIFLTSPSPSIDEYVLAKAPTESFLQIKLFKICDSKIQQFNILQEEVNTSKGGLSSLVDSLREFLNTLNKANKYLQIHLPKPKL